MSITRAEPLPVFSSD